jgi:hypothetical protein
MNTKYLTKYRRYLFSGALVLQAAADRRVQICYGFRFAATLMCVIFVGVPDRDFTWYFEPSLPQVHSDAGVECIRYLW